MTTECPEKTSSRSCPRDYPNLIITTASASSIPCCACRKGQSGGSTATDWLDWFWFDCLLSASVVYCWFIFSSCLHCFNICFIFLCTTQPVCLASQHEQALAHSAGHILCLSFFLSLSSLSSIVIRCVLQSCPSTCVVLSSVSCVWCWAFNGLTKTERLRLNLNDKQRSRKGAGRENGLFSTIHDIANLFNIMLCEAKEDWSNPRSRRGTEHLIIANVGSIGVGVVAVEVRGFLFTVFDVRFGVVGVKIITMFCFGVPFSEQLSLFFEIGNFRSTNLEIWWRRWGPNKRWWEIVKKIKFQIFMHCLGSLSVERSNARPKANSTAARRAFARSDAFESGLAY